MMISIPQKRLLDCGENEEALVVNNGLSKPFPASFNGRRLSSVQIMYLIWHLSFDMRRFGHIYALHL